MKGLVRGDIGPVPRTLKLLYDHRELIDAIFHQREQFIDALDPRFHLLEMLHRERILRLEREAGGATVRLPSHIRQMLSAITRDQRIQALGVGVEDAMKRIRHLADDWARHHAQGEPLEADATEDELTEAVEEIELLYAEQLERLDDRISGDYGFDEHSLNRANAYRYYIERLETMYRGANTFLTELRSEDFANLGFIDRLATKFEGRFRLHGQKILDLLSTLERYINNIRTRQALTRRNRKFLTWLRKQPAIPPLANAEAAALEHRSLHRAPRLALGGFPDLQDRLLESYWLEIQTSVDKRRRRNDNALRRVEREPSGQRSDSAQSQQLGVAQERARRAQQWNAHAWTLAYLKEVVRAAAHAGHGVDLSAADFWRTFEPPASLGPLRPTYRAWLSAVVVMAFNNRGIGNRPFFGQFEVRVEPELPDRLLREQAMLQDIRIRLRDDALRQRLHERRQRLGLGVVDGRT